MQCIQNCEDSLKAYFLNNYAIFSDITYSSWIGFYIIFINLIATLIWNYRDLFIVLISVSLTWRFRQLNELLIESHGKNMPSTFWKRVRKDFNTLSLLTKIVDDVISKIVLVSFGSNMYFVCAQLLNSMRRSHISRIMKIIYYVWSFCHLMLRTAALCLYAADINEESQVPKSLIYSVSSESYCKETDIMLNQVIYDKIALTGLKFFYVTRSLILTLAGTIVTYEIVLVQFGNLNSDGESFNSTSPNIKCICN